MIHDSNSLSVGALSLQLRVSGDAWLSRYVAAIDTASRRSGFNLSSWEDANAGDAVPALPPHPAAMAISEYYVSISALFTQKNIRS